MKAHGWSPLPSSADLSNQSPNQIEKVLARRLGYRDGETFTPGETYRTNKNNIRTWDSRQRRWNKMQYWGPPSLGELGCAAAHHQLWKRLAQEQNANDWALVTEDDRALNDVPAFCDFVERVNRLKTGQDGTPVWD